MELSEPGIFGIQGRARIGRATDCLEVFGLEVGLVVNFGGGRLGFRWNVNGLNRGLR